MLRTGAPTAATWLLGCFPAPPDPQSAAALKRSGAPPAADRADSKCVRRWRMGARGNSKPFSTTYKGTSRVVTCKKDNPLVWLKKKRLQNYSL